MKRRQKWMWWLAIVVLLFAGCASLGGDDEGGQPVQPRATVPAASIRFTSFRSRGPGGGGAVFAAVFHNRNPDIILAGQDVGGVSKSTDGGATWRHVNQGGLSLPWGTADLYWISELTAHPTDDNVFFASTAAGLFRSDDVGETWTRLIPDDPLDVWGIGMSWLAFSPNSQVALAATGDWHSPDPGEGEGIYRSQDGGRTFTQVAAQGIPGQANIAAIAFDPATGDAYAATEAGLYRSTDNGDSFSKVSGPFRHQQGQWIGIGRSGNKRVFWYVLQTLGDATDPASWSGGVYRSNDGANWEEVTGYPQAHPDSEELLRAMGARVHPTNPDILLLNLRTDEAQGGLYRYDGGWTNLTASFQDNAWCGVACEVAPEGVAIASANPDVIISTNELGILKTTDGGSTWAQLSIRKAGDGWTGTGAEVTYAYDLAVSGSRMYVGFEDIGVWRSDDRGASWRLIKWDLPAADGSSEVYVHPQDADRVYFTVGSWSNGLREDDATSRLYKSTDGGATTTEITPPAVPASVGRAALAVAWGATPAQDILYAAFHGDSVYRSQDGGQSWQEIASGFQRGDKSLVFALEANPADPDEVVAGLYTDSGVTFGGPFSSAGGLYRTTDGGAHWQRLENYPYKDVAFADFVGQPARLFVGGWTYNESQGAAEGALLVSDDRANFTSVLAQPFVRDVIAAPGQPDALYAAVSSDYMVGQGQQAGIYRSTDNGQSWRRIPGQLPHNYVLSLAFFPDDPQMLYMGTNGDGVIQAALGGDGQSALYLPTLFRR